MRTRWPAALLFAAALVGCQPADEARADPARVRPGQPFVLAGGQEATVEGTDLRLRFADVLEDSRCPTQVDCVWTGQARIAVDLASGTAQQSVEFTLNPAPGQAVQVDAQGYTVTLETLDPYPATPDPIPFEDYRATLTVVGN